MRDRFKNLLGLNEDPYLEEDDNEEEGYAEDTAMPAVRRDGLDKEERSMSTVGAGLKPKLVIHEPITYEDGPKILDDIKNRKIVVIDFETLELEKKKQIFEFVNGGIYAMEAQIRKVTKDIFVVAPKGVDVEGKSLDSFPIKGEYPL